MAAPRKNPVVLEFVSSGTAGLWAVELSVPSVDVEFLMRVYRSKQLPAGQALSLAETLVGLLKRQKIPVALESRTAAHESTADESSLPVSLSDEEALECLVSPHFDVSAGPVERIVRVQRAASGQMSVQRNDSVAASVITPLIEANCLSLMGRVPTALGALELDVELGGNNAVQVVDVIKLGGRCVRHLPYRHRRQLVETIASNLSPPHRVELSAETRLRLVHALTDRTQPWPEGLPCALLFKNRAASRLGGCQSGVAPQGEWLLRQTATFRVVDRWKSSSSLGRVRMNLVAPRGDPLIRVCASFAARSVNDLPAPRSLVRVSFLALERSSAVDDKLVAPQMLAHLQESERTTEPTPMSVPSPTARSRRDALILSKRMPDPCSLTEQAFEVDTCARLERTEHLLNEFLTAEPDLRSAIAQG